MDKLIIEYALTALEAILVCILIGSLIAVYTTCNLAASVYEDDVGIRKQHELYVEYAKYDEKEITDTDVLSLLARGVNLPEGIKLYSTDTSFSAFKTLKCNETINITDSKILSDLRENIIAGTYWYSKVITNADNGEISYIEIRKLKV